MDGGEQAEKKISHGSHRKGREILGKLRSTAESLPREKKVEEAKGAQRVSESRGASNEGQLEGDGAPHVVNWPAVGVRG